VHRRSQFRAHHASLAQLPLAFTANPGPLQRWGLRIVDRHIVVDSTSAAVAGDPSVQLFPGHSTESAA
jgi:hypothetical protein